MASEMLGRTKCPGCGFDHAHVKIKTDKEKARAYLHCPDCGLQYFPKSDRQEKDLRDKINAAKLDEAPSMRPLMEPEPAPSPAPAKPEEPKSYKYVFGVKVPT